MLYPHPYVLNPVPVPKRRQSLMLWLNPDDASTHDLDGLSVNRLYDASGRGNHAVKTTDSQRPTIELIDGRKTLRFDGTDDKMTGETGKNLLSGDDDFTVFAVVRKIGNPTSGNAYFVIGNDKSYGLSVGVDIAGFGGVLNGGVAWHTDPSGSVPNGILQRQTMRRDEVPNVIYYTRGATIEVNWTNNPGSLPYGAYSLGRHGDSLQALNICEIVMFHENMHESYRSEINKYLNDRWGTT